MSDHAWERSQELFHAALSLSPERRDAFLEHACQGDAELLSELRDLLEAHDDDDGSFEGPLRIDAPTLSDFEVIEALGAGSMGAVFRAWQYSLQRMVAIKTLPPLLATSQRVVDRFQREARAMAKLDHPGIVRVHAVGEDAGTHYFVMEYVAGRDLAGVLDRMRERRAESSDPDLLPEFGSANYVEAVVRLCAAVAQALQHAHENGIVHRDVKPHNILLDSNGAPRVADFGLARDDTSPALTKTGELAGTPYYMSPEQARASSPARRVDHRTDIYSLGVVIYELLTLNRPFEGKTSIEVLQKITTTRPRPISEASPDVPRDLQNICEKAMRKGKAQRYASAQELALDLERFLRHQTVTAQPMSWVERARDLHLRRPVLSSVLLATGLAAALASAGTLALNELRDRRVHAAAMSALSSPEELRALVSVGESALPQLESELAELRRIEWRWEESAQPLAERRGAIEEVALRIAEGAIVELTALLSPGGEQRDRGRTQDCLETAVAASRLTTTNAAALTPIVDAIHPSISLTTVPAGALISAVPLDPLTALPSAAPIELGPSPLSRQSLPAGYFLFLARAADGRTAEHIGTIRKYAGVHALPELHLRAPQEAAADMIRIEAGPFDADPPAPDASQLAPPFLRGSVHLPGFWIDRHEVTNAAYREFCLATERPFPAFWPDEWNPEWDRLPVALVSAFDAEQYAAWAGKRLPTYPEWTRAARGRTPNPYPWGSAPPTEARPRANVALEPVADPDALSLEERWAAYLRAVVPVGTLVDDRSPDGVADCMGNVMEWTASPSFVTSRPGDWSADPAQRFALGGAWSVRPRPLDHRRPAANQSTDSAIGFRCARTLPD